MLKHQLKQLILNLLEVYLSNLTKYTWLQSILTTAINDTALFLGAILFIKIAKKDNLFDAILLCVCLYAGYMVMNSLDVLINSLFINVEIVVGESTFTTGAIILNDLSFKSIILEFLNTFINDVIFMSLIIGCSAIINGGVIGLNVSPLKDETYNEWSIYLLFIITVILHVGAIFPSTIILFNVILKTLSAVFLVILAILIINYYLSKIHVDSQE